MAIVSETCRHRGCGAPATHFPRLRIPLKGWPIELHRPAVIDIGVPLCKRCAKRLPVDTWVNDRMAQSAQRMREYVGKPELDFARAYVQSKPLEDCQAPIQPLARS